MISSNSRNIDSFKEKCFIPIPDPHYYNEDIVDSLGDRLKYKTLSEIKQGRYTTWKFNGTDNFRKFSENIRKKEFQNWYYKTNEVKYTLNCLGYRTKDFDQIDWANSVVIFGCSFVSGVGVDDRHTISSFLERELGIPVINMGVAGSSNLFHLHNSTILSSFYPTPKAVIYSCCGLTRYPKFEWGETIHYGAWCQEKEYKNNLCDSTIRNLLSMINLKNLWKDKTTCIHYSWDHFQYDFIKKTIPDLDLHLIQWNANQYEAPKTLERFFARDLNHPGPILNRRTASELTKILRSHNI